MTVKPQMRSLVRVAGLLRFLRDLMGGLKAGGRWSVTETDGVAEVRERAAYRFPGQVVPGAGGADVEYFWAGGPFEFQPLGGRITGSGWVCVRVVHHVLWTVGDVSLLRTITLESVDLVVLSSLVDAVPATVNYVTSPDLAITAQSPLSVVHWPLAYLSGDTVTHLESTDNKFVGTGVMDFNPVYLITDET